MTETSTDTCRNCGTVLDITNRDPCPNCGKTARQRNIVWNETMTFTDKVVVSKTRQYYKKHPKTTAILIGIWLGSSIIGHIIGGEIGLAVGIVLGGLSFVVPASITNVKETERFEN